jgi:cytochrome b6-f complex iron-sulfur subunit
LNRKEFLKTSALALAAFTIGPSLVESCAKSSSSPSGVTVPFTVDLSNSANTVLNNVGGSIYSNGVIVTRISSADTGFVALAQACTHEGCTIAFNNSSQTFVCPCHGGTFGLNGNVISVPPPGPVTKYTVTRNNNILSVN